MDPHSLSCIPEPILTPHHYQKHDPTEHRFRDHHLLPQSCGRLHHDGLASANSSRSEASSAWRCSAVFRAGSKTPRPDQADAVTGRKNPRPDIRGPIQPVEAEALLRVWVDGGIDTADAAQRQALEDLAAADMVTRGDLIDVLPDNVVYSLRMLSEPSPPTDTPHVAVR
ncbi:hypothetical protein [Streptomyces candidus]|uniref:Uncharacterized protein n=1 Tax=Streptomyces candidus TaxID=67283 RepID=A0A7X0HNI7_9ACTN|nr:hypothetical protein [Streptomyces candidus]MBB6439433.1 hypothetical protein [Streptomyces candidus]GHH54755.1 hypothetical protein GCM10018773_58240 [Streptomyces candidus]